MDIVTYIQSKFYENQIVFEKVLILAKNAKKFSYFHRFHFAASLSHDLDPYSKKRL